MKNYPMNDHCFFTEFFLVRTSRIGTEYGDLLRKSPFSVRMRENTDQKKLSIWTLFTQWMFFKKYPVSYYTHFK